MCAELGQGHSWCPGPAPPPWDATWPWGQGFAPQWDGTAMAGSAALPEPPLLPSPLSHPTSGQGQEPPPNCCGHGSGRSWCACVCWDPGDNGSPCFGAKPCAAFGVRAEQEPPWCPGCPGAGSTGKALLGQRGHSTPWNRAGTRAAFPRSQAAHRNPARLRPLLSRLSPSPLGNREGGDTHGAVLGAGGRAVGTRGCHLPSEPCQGAVPISIGHHPARPEQGMSRLRAAGDGAPRGAAVPQHAGMSSRSSSCRPGLPYPAQMGSMGPILSGYPHVQC